jgi:hypothetical protein
LKIVSSICGPHSRSTDSGSLDSSTDSSAGTESIHPYVSMNVSEEGRNSSNRVCPVLVLLKTTPLSASMTLEPANGRVVVHSLYHSHANSIRPYRALETTEIMVPSRVMYSVMSGKARATNLVVSLSRGQFVNRRQVHQRC